MKIIFLPKTKLGKCSVRQIVLAAISFGVFQFFVSTGYRGGSGFFDNPYLAIPISLFALFSTASFFTGLIGIIRNQERSALTILSASIGFLIFLFFLAEIISPH